MLTEHAVYHTLLRRRIGFIRPSNHIHLLRLQSIQSTLRQSQRVRHDLLWGRSDPLAERHIWFLVSEVSRELVRRARNKEGLTRELIRLQYLDKDQILIAGVLDIMAVRLREIPHVSSTEVKGSGGAGRGKQSRSTLALDEECPLVAGRMPVNLAHAAWMHGDHGSGEVVGDGEGQRIDDLDGSAFHLVGGLLGEMVGVALALGNNARAAGHILLADVGWRGRAGEDVQFVLGDIVEGGDGEVKVLG